MKNPKAKQNLKQLLGICEHIWDMFQWNEIVDEYGDKIGIRYHLKCKKCGIIKFIKSKQ